MIDSSNNNKRTASQNTRPVTMSRSVDSQFDHKCFLPQSIKGKKKNSHIVYGFRSLEMLIFTFILYLNFNFNKQLYDQLCHCCHRLCFEFCLNLSDANKKKWYPLSQMSNLGKDRDKLIDISINSYQLLDSD